MAGSLPFLSRPRRPVLFAHLAPWRRMHARHGRFVSGWYGIDISKLPLLSICPFLLGKIVCFIR